MTNADIDRAVKAGIISAEQAESIKALSSSHQETLHQTPRFIPLHILYYVGGLIAIGAMTIFINLGWESFGGWGVLSISLFYALVLLLIVPVLERRGLTLPAGMATTFVVCLTPLAMYGLQIGMGWWPTDSPNAEAFRDFHRVIQWHWVYLELATLLVGAIMLWRYRYPFLVMPIAVTLWYMSMDVAAMLSPQDMGFTVRSQVSLAFGLGMIVLALWVDFQSQPKQDYPFWLYLFGVLTFWGGLHMLSNETPEYAFIVFLCSLVLLVIGALIRRKVFVVFGAFGLFRYLNYLAWFIFEDSWGYPITLTLIGAGIVGLGIYWQQHEHQLHAALQERLPSPLQRFLNKKYSR